jgi:hypothetical protein
MKSFLQTNNITNVLVLTLTTVLLLSRHVTGIVVAAPLVAAAGTAAGAAAGGAAVPAATAGVAGATATATGGTAAGIAGTTGGIAAATTGTAAIVATGGLILLGALADEVSYEIIVENQLASLPNFTEFAGTNYNETNNELNYVESEDRYNRHLDLISMMRMEKPSRNIIS